MLETVQKSTTKMIKGLYDLSCKERLRESWDCLTQRTVGLGRMSSVCKNSWAGGAEKTELGSFQWCLGDRRGSGHQMKHSFF